MILLDNISKKFGEKEIFNDFSLKIERNTFTTITGKSGSGKTTLLNIIGLIEKPDNGTITINGISKFNYKSILKLRRYNFGYIFQEYALLEDETVKENLIFTSKYNKKFSNEDMINSLERVGMSKEYLDMKTSLLSGGEKQRVAIARIMLKPCDIILADEPTGNLDDENANIIIGFLKDLIRQGKTVICVTHDQKIASVADNNISICNI